MATDTIYITAEAATEDEAYEQALRAADRTYRLESSASIRKVRGQSAWYVGFLVSGRHDGREISARERQPESPQAREARYDETAALLEQVAERHAPTATVGHGHELHATDGRPYPEGRTLCGLAWTDEHPSDAPVSCSRCRSRLTGNGRASAGDLSSPQLRQQPATALEYRDVRVGSTEHLTTDPAGLYEARTLCGIALAGTPVGPVMREVCQACQALQPCDECGHVGGHLWAPALESLGAAELATRVYREATCWAENVCVACAPALYAELAGLMGEHLGACPACGTVLIEGGNPDCATCAAEPGLAL